MSHVKKNLQAFSRAIAALTPKCTPTPPPPPPPPLSPPLLTNTLNIDSYLQPSSNNVYSDNRAIDDLVKSGCLSSAHKLFDEMLERDVVTWNILISGYGRLGFSTQALYLYNQMVYEGVRESSSTFSTVLSICCDAGAFEEGLQVHSRVIALGLEMNVYVGSALVDLYLSMGFSDFALRLFNDLPERNVSVWNLVLRGFGELGGSNELFGLYNDMLKEGVSPNPLTFCYLIRGCRDENLVDEGKKLHCHAIKIGWSESNVFVANALVDMYSACRSLPDAKRAYEIIPPADVISWNSLVSIYCKSGLLGDAIEIFARMQFWGRNPSTLSIIGLLNLSSENSNLLLGKQVHCFVVKLGFECSSIHVQSALIHMYGKCAEINTSVSIFESLPMRTLETCNSLMSSFLHRGLVEDVVELFGLMSDEGTGFDEVSLSSSLKALSVSSLASLTSCTLLHCSAVKSGFECEDAVSSSLIDAYSRLGHVYYSLQVFKQLPSANVICWTSIIKAHAQNGKWVECIELLESMIQKGLKPDRVTILCVLTGCNHSGMVEEGRLLFDQMKSLHGINPDRQHFSCMVDLLGRAGLLDEAENLVRESPVNDDSVIWSSLLRSCRVHQNKRVGRRVAKKLTDLEPENPSILLHASNFYAEIGEFETAMQIREVAMARKMQRDIGYSFIEVDGPI